MAVQARAEVTRTRIIDAAVGLSDGTRYGETGLADIINRAEVAKGAVYYHFPSKESVAMAIIEQYEDDFRATMTDGIRRAVAQGDVAADVDVDGLARTIWSASLGNRVLSDQVPGRQGV